MRTLWPRAAALTLATCLPCCGGDVPLGPISLPPVSCSSEWRIRGFSEAEVGTLAARLPVGHSRELFVYPASGIVGDCDDLVASIRWASEHPDVAEVIAQGTAPRYAWLTGWAVGETRVSADVVLSDGRTVTAPLTAGGDEHLVRVVPASDPSLGQNVLLEGTVELEPENPTQTPSTRAYLVFDVPAPGLLSMFLDWGSVSNDVGAHMCPGEVSYPAGCRPIIDGSRLEGRKPISASTETTPGVHTLWITNGGPEAETVRYLVGLIPD